MAITQDEVTKEVVLDIPPDVPKSVSDNIKKQVGDYLVAAILDEVGSAKSPVSGKNFKQLSKEYADEHKGGDRSPNLDLEGDMLNALKYKKTEDGIEIGIFSSKEAPKAYNHNVGDTLPRRQFIPEESQNFVGFIDREVKSIVKTAVKDFRDERFEPQRQERRTPSEQLVTTVTSNDTFDSFIRGLFNGGKN